jgi:hypothetical protein
VPSLPSELYEKVLNDPAYRDPRGYIISAAQDDFATAVKFINVLLKHGVDVHKATAAFTVACASEPPFAAGAPELTPPPLVGSALSAAGCAPEVIPPPPARHSSKSHSNSANE